MTWFLDIIIPQPHCFPCHPFLSSIVIGRTKKNKRENWEIEWNKKQMDTQQWAVASSSRKSNTHTYGAAQAELFPFYQTSVLSKIWCPSSWGPCEESLGCYWHCQARGCLAPGRQLNYCKPQRRANAHFNATFTSYLDKTCFLYKCMKGDTHGLLKFSPFLPTFPLNQTEIWFHILGPRASKFSLKKLFLFQMIFALIFIYLFFYNLKLISKQKWLY